MSKETCSEGQGLLEWGQRRKETPPHGTCSRGAACVDVSLPGPLRESVLSCFRRVRLCDPVDCSPPGSSVHGISQARLLEWVATPPCSVSSRPRDRTRVSYVSCIGRRVLQHHLGRPPRAVPSELFAVNYLTPKP